MPLSKVLKELRKKSGLTQVELAERAGVKVDTLRHWEQGTYAYPRVDALAKLARALGVSLDIFVTEGRGSKKAS